MAGSRPEGGEPWDAADIGEDSSLTAVESLAVIEAQREQVRRRVDVDPAVLFAIWGAAWAVGFGAAYLAYGPGRVIPAWSGPSVAAVLTVAGMVASAGYAISLGRGVSGLTRSTGAMYGWSWMLGFLCLAVVNTALIRRGLPADGAALLWSSSALLLTGVLYLAGGALYNDRVQYGVGVWTLLSAAGAVFAGVPGNFLVMAAAGGGGFLALAAYYRLDPAGRLGRR